MSVGSDDMKLDEYERDGEMYEKVERWDPRTNKNLTFERKFKRRLIPSKEQYHMTLKRLIEQKSMTMVLILRMGSEMGLSRLDICNAEINNIDRDHTRGLWINISKAVRCGNTNHNGKIVAKYVMRSREVPINVNLYSYIQNYINKNTKYILKRKNDMNITQPHVPRHLNWYYKDNNIPWATHKSRHYFKSQVMNWMRANRCVDVALIKEYMGHHKDTHESYGEIDWEYKLDVIDQVFS